ncbi:MAG: hypothetical protein ACRERC_07190 [Candidatus Binatia bacterium]
MSRIVPASRSLLLLALLVGLAACGDDDGSPRPTATPTATSTAAPTATATAPPTITATRVPSPSATASATVEPSPTPTLSPTTVPTSPLRVGVAALRLSPCGPNPDYDGPITASGVWGEEFTDVDGNGRWDDGEPFIDDPANTALDPRSAEKYDGIFLAGFGNDRIATSCHDDLWARVLVLQGPTHTVALVSVDFVGVVAQGLYAGFAHARALVDPTLGIDQIIFSSTHSHEGPDTLGLWGVDEATDGKFPRYLQFVDRQIAKAINAAAAPAALQPVRVTAATTDPMRSPDLRGLQVRTRCRPPFFFDAELRALQFVDGAGATVATLVNWSTHPESLEDQNTAVSSDFVHYIRNRVERDLGGTAVYFTGDLGAAEIVGDTCVGGASPHADDGSNEFDRRDDLGFARTEQIGELVGGAVVSALGAGEALAVADVEVARADYHVTGTNLIFSLGARLGVLDTDPVAFDLANCPPGAVFCAPVEQYLVRLLGAQAAPLVEMITAPGEIFPELFYGTEEFHRTDCPAAHTGEPYEPSIRNAMRAPYRFLLGLSPDEFGYIVPGYDFFPAPGLFEEADDPCQGQSFDPAIPRRMVPSHYHEGLSIGLDIAATSTCYALRLLGREDELAANAACQRTLGLP